MQLELARQKRYCQDHHISTYHWSNEKHPLSARITCSTCGSTFMQIKSKRKDEEGKRYWRCSSFIGNRGTEIEGRTFTIIRPDRGSTEPYNIRRRKKPGERPMLCTDIRIPAGEPDLAFIKAWNLLVDDIESYLLEWQQAIYGNELLKAYRTRELIGLVEQVGHIDAMPYGLMLKTLDHIEISLDGGLKLIFLAEGMVEKGDI